MDEIYISDEKQDSCGESSSQSIAEERQQGAAIQFEVVEGD
jgi:hypothetical protein